MMSVGEKNMTLRLGSVKFGPPSSSKGVPVLAGKSASTTSASSGSSDSEMSLSGDERWPMERSSSPLSPLNSHSSSKEASGHSRSSSKEASGNSRSSSKESSGRATSTTTYGAAVLGSASLLRTSAPGLLGVQYGSASISKKATTRTTTKASGTVQVAAAGASNADDGEGEGAVVGVMQSKTAKVNPADPAAVGHAVLLEQVADNLRLKEEAVEKLKGQLLSERQDHLLKFQKADGLVLLRNAVVGWNFRVALTRRAKNQAGLQAQVEELTTRLRDATEEHSRLSKTAERSLRSVDRFSEQNVGLTEELKRTRGKVERSKTRGEELRGRCEELSTRLLTLQKGRMRSLVGALSGARSGTCFQAWRAVWKEAREARLCAEREAGMLSREEKILAGAQAQLQELEARLIGTRGQLARRCLGALMGTALRSCFQAWKSFLRETELQTQLQGMEERLIGTRGQLARRCLGALMGAALRSCFQAWKSFLREQEVKDELCQETDELVRTNRVLTTKVEDLSRQLFQVRGRAVRQLVGAWQAGTAGAVRSCLLAWRSHTREERAGLAEAGENAELCRENEELKADLRRIKESEVGAWRTRCEKLACRNEVLGAQLIKGREALARRLVGVLSGTSLRTVLQGWHGFVREIRALACAAELRREREFQAQRSREARLRRLAMGALAGVSRRTVFQAWRGQVWEARLVRDAEATRDELASRNTALARELRRRNAESAQAQDYLGLLREWAWEYAEEEEERGGIAGATPSSTERRGGLAALAKQQHVRKLVELVSPLGFCKEGEEEELIPFAQELCFAARATEEKEHERHHRMQRPEDKHHHRAGPSSSRSRRPGSLLQQRSPLKQLNGEEDQHRVSIKPPPVSNLPSVPVMPLFRPPPPTTVGLAGFAPLQVGYWTPAVRQPTSPFLG